MAQTTFQPSEFATFAGVRLAAVLVTIGVRSTAAALIAGVVLAFPNAIFTYYWPSATWLTYALQIAFGLGAIFRGQVPRWRLAEQSRRLQMLMPAVQADPSRQMSHPASFERAGGRTPWTVRPGSASRYRDDH